MGVTGTPAIVLDNGRLVPAICLLSDWPPNWGCRLAHRSQTGRMGAFGVAKVTPLNISSTIALFRRRPMEDSFQRIERLPPYIFSITDTLKRDARARGEDIVDFGMGNPDQPTPPHIVSKLIETVQRGDTHRYSNPKGSQAPSSNYPMV